MSVIFRVTVPGQHGTVTALGVGGVLLLESNTGNPLELKDSERIVIETERHSEPDGRSSLEYIVRVETKVPVAQT